MAVFADHYTSVRPQPDISSGHLADGLMSLRMCQEVATRTYSYQIRSGEVPSCPGNHGTDTAFFSAKALLAHLPGFRGSFYGCL